MLCVMCYVLCVMCYVLCHGILYLGGRRVIHYATEAAIDVKCCNKDIYMK